MENKSKSRKIVYGIIFLILAVIIAVVCSFILKNNDNYTAEIPENDEIKVTDVLLSEETGTEYDETESLTVPSETESEPVSVFSRINPDDFEWTEASGEKEVNDILDKEKNKLCKLSVNEIAEEGDLIDTISFVLRSEDEATAIGPLKCGFGISVDASCPDSTNNNWYQSDDYSSENEGSSCTVVWEIPDEIKEYITVSSGMLTFGYWWGEPDRIVLEKVECSRRTVK